MRRSHPYESLREGRVQTEEPTYTEAKGWKGLGLFEGQDKGQCAWCLVILSEGDVCAESQRTRACQAEKGVGTAYMETRRREGNWGLSSKIGHF